MTQQPDWLKGMKGKADEVNSRISGGGAFLKRLNLTGKNAIVKPGGQVVLRLLPRWDIQHSIKVMDGKMVSNPNYKGGPVFLLAYEHWWDGEGGTRVRVWCPLSSHVDTYTMNLPKDIDPTKLCPICDASEKLRGSPDSQDKKYGNDLAKGEVFLFNAVARDPVTKRRMLDDQGHPDIRVLPAQGTIFVAISNIMTGGGEAEFGRGDITNVKEGYDIKLTRPQGQGQRWAVEVAPNATAMVTPEERAVWGQWHMQLINLVDWVAAEMKPAEELHKLYYGAEAGAPAEIPTASAPDPSGFGAAVPAPPAASPPVDPGKAAPTPPVPPVIPPATGSTEAPPPVAPPPATGGEFWGLD